MTERRRTLPGRFPAMISAPCPADWPGRLSDAAHAAGVSRSAFIRRAIALALARAERQAAKVRG